MPEPVEGSGPGPRPVDVISLITMLLTISAAVLLYMGWAYLDGFLTTFDVRPTDVRFGADEYILHSLSVFSADLLPWLVLAPLAFAAVVHRAELARLLPRRVRHGIGRLRRRRVVRVATDARFAGAVLTLAGLVLAVVALTRHQIGIYLVLAPAVAGPLLLTWPARRRRGSGITFAVGVVASAFCLLWGVFVYAQEQGRRKAEEMAANLPYRTQVALYAKDALALNAPGVTRQAIKSGKYRYLYTGLRLLLSREDRYYLLPVVTKEQVRNGESRTFVLTPGDDLRLELLPGVRAPHPD
ncbi:hypothetical protein AB0K18_40740 [Nonomuraea sp. NPDC049421]|uniref:hypothetical protein n=1 Tax=Nonomuraea sp. NPDC049421 TaxID=3155275 RepID=UPI00342C07A9